MEIPVLFSSKLNRCCTLHAQPRGDTLSGRGRQKCDVTGRRGRGGEGLAKVLEDQSFFFY